MGPAPGCEPLVSGFPFFEDSNTAMTTSETITAAPPHDPARIVAAPFPERVKLACQNWAYASPNRPSVMALYWAKYFFVLIGVWAFWCSFNAGYTSFFNFTDWVFTTEAFKKAMVWSMCWELFLRLRLGADERALQ